MPTDLEHDVLASVRDALAAAPRGSRAHLVEQAAGLLNCSVPTAYRKLKLAGFDSARKRRSDAGECMLSIEQLRLVSGVLMASMNQKGQRMPVGTALSILRASGQLDSPASDGTVGRQLYAHMLHPEQLALPSEAVRLTSEHPNHVWQVDSTTGAYYYLPGGRLRWMDESEVNKNKVTNLAKVASDLLTRYSATDHTTHAFKVRYFLGGESAQNLIEFLVWAMWRQGVSPMHGVPRILMADQGSANKSHLMAAFCKRLGIELLLHTVVADFARDPLSAGVVGEVSTLGGLTRQRQPAQLHREVAISRAVLRLSEELVELGVEAEPGHTTPALSQRR